jgi:hypothetical protein
MHEDGKQYLFLHRTFQEYLTACYLNQVSDGIALAKAHFLEYEWHETLSLVAGLMQNPVPLIQAIAAEKDDIFKTLLLLAGRCIKECKESSHPLITKIIYKIYRFWRKYPYADFIQSVVVAIAQINLQMFQKVQESLNDSSTSVRTQAAFVLGEIGNPKAVPVLSSTLNDSDSGVRSRAAFALGKIGNSQAVPALSNVLTDSDNNVRLFAVWALGKIGNSKAVPALSSNLNDPDSEVRLFAVWALDKMGNLPPMLALSTPSDNSDSNIGVQPIFALPKMSNPQAVNALINALNNSDANVGLQAAKDLGTIGNSDTLDKLIKALDINIYDPHIFSLARTLAIRFSKDKLPFIPVYPKLVRFRFSPLLATVKCLGQEWQEIKQEIRTYAMSTIFGHSER